MDLGLEGRACIVTGASRGIGRATAVALAAEGAKLVLAGRDADALAETMALCQDAGTVIVDVTEPDGAQRLVGVCTASFGRLDVVVNNAGATAVRKLSDLTDDDWQDQWDLNVMAPMRLMRAAAPLMAAAGWGRIVNVSSSSGKRPSGSNMAYSVTKAAELSLSRAFADMYASRNVLVNAITPGPIGNEMWLAPGGLADQLAEQRGQTRDEVLQSTAGRTPLGRLGHEREIADVIVFLCSERASNVAGAAWSVDGGTVPVII